MDGRRANGCHYFPRWVTALWLSLGILALLTGAACRQGVTPVALGPTIQPGARGTITGVIHGNLGGSALTGRTVEVINVATGERRKVQTGDMGGFAIDLPAGQYRLDVAVNDGETILKRPGVIKLDGGDLESRVEFLLSSRIARPRGPAYRLDNGLGSPIA